LGILVGAALVVTFLGLGMTLARSLLQAGLDDRVLSQAMLIALLGLVWYLRNWHSGLADRFLLGVQLTRFNMATNVATLWLKDERRAPHFAELTPPSMPPSASPAVVAEESNPNPYRAPATTPDKPTVPIIMRTAVAPTPRAALILTGCGALMLLMNHEILAAGGGLYPGLVLMGPPCLLLGAIGIWKPQLVRAIGTRGIPWSLRIVSLVVIAIGLTTGVWLLMKVYL
jgi:hypothetical protein